MFTGMQRNHCVENFDLAGPLPVKAQELSLIVLAGLLVSVCSVQGQNQGRQTRMGTAGIYILPNAAKELPPGVPRGVDTNGDVVTIPMEFTTKLFHDAALDLVLQEANQVARELQLPEELPITRSNIVTGYIDEFGWYYLQKQVGNVTTKNYTYCVSVDDKFSYLEGTHRDEQGWKYSAEYSWPVSQIDTNLAYQPGHPMAV
jgi:hypothetical protein